MYIYIYIYTYMCVCVLTCTLTTAPPSLLQSVSTVRYPQLLGCNCPPSRRSFITFGVKVRV